MDTAFLGNFRIDLIVTTFSGWGFGVSSKPIMSSSSGCETDHFHSYHHWETISFQGDLSGAEMRGMKL